jgi:hypothetical protein
VWWRGECIWRLRHDAVDLEYVLAAFVEEEWPDRLHLQRPEGIDRKSGNWLRAAAKAGTKTQNPLRIRCYRNGAANQVCWEVVV